MSLTRSRETEWMRERAVLQSAGEDVCYTSFDALRTWCVCVCACVRNMPFYRRCKKFCCAKRHKSGSSEAWACIGRLRHTVAANFPCENVNRQSQLAHSTLIHCSVHNAPWKDWSKNLAVRVIWRLRTHFPPYKVIARARVFMQGIKLLAASGDGGNVSPDGCHTPVVKEFLWVGAASRRTCWVWEPSGIVECMW